MSQITPALWSEILGHLRDRHGELAKGWFSQLDPPVLERGELTVATPDVQQHSYLTERCRQAFVEAAQLAINRLVTVRFRLAEAIERVDGEVVASVAYDPPPLNKLYTFEHFVTGPCNRMAHAAAVAVAEAPGQAYNPLFLHGSVGLGKTHLLQAACQRALEAGKVERVLYLSCESFTNDFIDAVQRGALNSFRYRYRHVDMLVIDDIQFLAERDRSQEEFFHTFNTLYQIQKQIILSADSAPTAIPSLEERLVSRFSWGLVAVMEKPCFETRMAILRQKAEVRGLELNDEVVYLIASRVDSNIRELEGAINRVESLAQITGGPITLAVARQALGEQAPIRQIGIPEIQEAVMRRYNVRLPDLQSRKRSKSITLPRQVCMYLARQLTRHSLEEIGGFFGGRDHTTVLHAIRTIGQQRQSDSRLHAALEEINDELRASGTN